MNLHPIVRFVVDEMKRQGWTLDQMQRISGVGRSTICHWALGERQPHLPNIEAVLNTLGYKILIVKGDAPRKKPTPRSLPTRLKPFRGRTKLTQEQVDDIRTQRLPAVEFAKLYGVSEAMVSMILAGKRWPEPPSRA